MYVVSFFLSFCTWPCKKFVAPAAATVVVVVVVVVVVTPLMRCMSSCAANIADLKLYAVLKRLVVARDRLTNDERGIDRDRLRSGYNCDATAIRRLRDFRATPIRRMEVARRSHSCRTTVAGKSRSGQIAITSSQSVAVLTTVIHSSRDGWMD